MQLLSMMMCLLSNVGCQRLMMALIAKMMNPTDASRITHDTDLGK